MYSCMMTYCSCAQLVRPRELTALTFSLRNLQFLDTHSFSLSYQPLPLSVRTRESMRVTQQAEHETPAPRPAELSAVENLMLTRPNLQQLMFEDVCAFRPECRAMAPGGGGGDPSPASTEFSDISMASPAAGTRQPSAGASGGGGIVGSQGGVTASKSDASRAGRGVGESGGGEGSKVVTDAGGNSKSSAGAVGMKGGKCAPAQTNLEAGLPAVAPT